MQKILFTPFIVGFVWSANAQEGSKNTSPPLSLAPAICVNWDTRGDSVYGFNEATQDFKTVTFWGGGLTRSHTSAGRLRVTLLKNSTAGEGGVISRVDIPHGEAYQLQFDVMFDNEFDFSMGGKIGFGFLIGQGNTGGVPGTNGNGGSARIMWYKNWDGRVYLKPYLYYKDQPGTWGDDFGKTYPSEGSIAKGQWHKVKMVVKSNTGSNTDGRIQIFINGTTLIDQAIRWTTNDAERMIKNICFETFRGGNEATWQSATDGFIYFANVCRTAL